MKLVVIGAGPIGLAAALGGVRRGFDVTVLERDEVGAALRLWGPTKFFSPLVMNVPPGAADLVSLPAPEALLTGAEFADQVLVPLASSEPLVGRIQTGHRVLSVSRLGMSRGELVGHPVRGERSFRILVETPAGERELEADAVIDASGVGLPTPLIAQHERSAVLRIITTLGELYARRDELAGRKIVLVGHGHSAANAIHVLASVAVEAPFTRVVWAVRAPNLRPCVEVASDPLPERARICAGANALAAKPPAWLRVERRARVEVIEPTRVLLSGGRVAESDIIVSLCGYRPDLSMLSELALDIAPASEGTGGIARRLANVTDCLATPKLDPADLASGEPRFHLAGAKSYGRARTFLLQTGYAQLETMLDGLA